jgi:hypothetical protein
MQKFYFSLIGFLLISSGLFSQELDWELTDIDGNMHHFFEELTPNRVGIIFFATTWSTTSWNAHNSGVLEELYQIYGPDGEDFLRVYFLESDQTTTLEDILGTGTNTKGDWTAAVSYPIFNLANGQVPSEYNISVTPTITLVDTAKMKAIHDLWGVDFTVAKVSEIIESYKPQSGIIESLSGPKFTMYPNPAREMIYLESEGLEVQGIEIVDITGKRLISIERHRFNSINELSISELEAGMYQIIVHSKEGKSSRRFIKVD